jgi:hypothetical protein
VPPLTIFFEKDFPALIQKMEPIVNDVITFFGDIGEGLKNFLDIDGDTSLLEGILEKFTEIGDNPDFTTFLGNVKTIFDEMAPVLGNIVFNVGELAVKLTPLLEGALNRVIPLLSDTARIFSGIDFFIGEIITRFGEFEGETPSFIEAIERQLNPMMRLQQAVKAIADAFDAAIAAYKRFQDLGGFEENRVITPPGAVRKRAGGGRVTGGMPYLVGEMGPELFMPGRGGNIVPNDGLGRGGGASIVINVNAGMGTNGAQVGEQIVNAIRRYERSSGPVFARA